MRIIQAVILLGFLTVVSIFAVQNQSVVTLSFLKWNLPAPVAILAVAIYFLGMLSGWTVFSLMTRSLRGVVDRPRS